MSSDDALENLTRQEPSSLLTDCVEAVAMLQDVATLDCGPDQASRWWARRGELTAKYLGKPRKDTKCDGNHGGPRCGDPECWNDEPTVRPHRVPKREEVERLMKRCQIGVGGRNALENAHSIMSDCYGMLGLLMTCVEFYRNRRSA